MSALSGKRVGLTSRAAFNKYNSNGACFTYCKSEYAFAVVLGTGCWCSNYAPGDTVPVYDRSDQCPGYPQELCGSSSQDLYGYVALNRGPSGTIDASSSAAPWTSSAVASSTVQAVSGPTFSVWRSSSSTSILALSSSLSQSLGREGVASDTDLWLKWGHSREESRFVESE